jgi:predicted dienelactone hydrolase
MMAGFRPLAFFCLPSRSARSYAGRVTNSAWPILLLALVAAPAFAQDACLTGASTLGDQRALATLRADTETACPCAATTSRRDYQRCAQAVADAAIANATLRPECDRTARDVRMGASCGTTRGTCGRFRADHDEPVSCRVKKASRCRDRARFEETACAAETHCADVVEWTAGTCVDVREKGPYGAGVHDFFFTKDSVVSPGTPRTIRTVVWYPTAPGLEPIDPQSDAVIDAPLEAAGAPYPIVLFSHGSCGYPRQSLFLTALLASHGFIVVAPAHPGNTLNEYPSCGTPTAQLDSYQERPRDVIFALDSVLFENADPMSAFFGALDETRIGMSGHSFGGLTTYLVTPLDSRFRVAVPLAPAVVGTVPPTVPSLTMLGQVDSVVDNDAIRNAYAGAESPKHLVEIANAGHYAFSDLCFPGPDCSPPATLTQPESHAAVRRWVLPFLKTHLAGDGGFAPFLSAPPPPGVVLEREP